MRITGFQPVAMGWKPVIRPDVAAAFIQWCHESNTSKAVDPRLPRVTQTRSAGVLDLPAGAFPSALGAGRSRGGDGAAPAALCQRTGGNRRLYLRGVGDLRLARGTSEMTLGLMSQVDPNPV